jgi:hypothetical protein
MKLRLQRKASFLLNFAQCSSRSALAKFHTAARQPLNAGHISAELEQNIAALVFDDYSHSGY